MDNFVLMALVATLGTWFVTALGAAMADRCDMGRAFNCDMPCDLRCSPWHSPHVGERPYRHRRRRRAFKHYRINAIITQYELHTIL